MDLSEASVSELNAELLRKTAPVESLDGLFTLPSFIEDTTLREAYEIIVARMRRECAHIAMNTIQQLLIERIAMNYIVLKYRESRPLGDDEGFTHAGVLKDWNTFWLKMTDEFNALMLKYRKSDADDIMALVKLSVEEILGTIPPEYSALRNDLIKRFVDTFARNGLPVS